MNLNKYFKWLFMLALLLTATACEDDPIVQNIQFNATIEPLQSSDPNAKVYLHNEEWIYWEIGDDISLGSNKTSGEPPVATLVNASQNSDFADFNGVFIAPLPAGSKYFLGLHPANAGNQITGHGESNAFDTPDPVINLYATQPRRPGEKEDYTFAKQVFPMVACFDAEWDAANPKPFNLNFHSLAGIVRIELYNNTSTNAQIDRIEFSSIDGDNTQLCGPFTVKEYNTNAPYLVSTTGFDDSCQTVTLTFGASKLEFNNGDIKTFYLVLPITDSGPRRVTNYHLAMRVYTVDKGHFTKNFTVPVQRNGLTNMRAIGITEWTATPTTTVGLAGDGSEMRPFKIYTLADMQYLREHYNGDRLINGQTITSGTYISLMRTDITLTTSTWPSGIDNFVGHFTDATHDKPNPGITNNSNYPIFTTILSGGHVKDLSVKSTTALLYTSSEYGVSTLCNNNAGIIEDCKVRGSISAIKNIGGIAGRNLAGGVIKGCECDEDMTLMDAATKIGGICYINEGTVQGCYTSTTLTITNATEAAGICYNNQGTVKDCYFAATINETTTNWGGIVFTSNTSSSTVQHCYFSGNIISLGTVGGIVHTVSDGTVDYCRLEGMVRGTQVGGIVHDITGGKIINCYANHPSANVIDTVYGGGSLFCGALAATISGGSIENSFANNVRVRATTPGPYVGGIVGTITGGTISNCYSFTSGANSFYGYTTLSVDALKTALSYYGARCFLVDHSQDGVQMVENNSSGMSTLLGSLSGNRPSDGHYWEGTPPRLQTSK